MTTGVRLRVLELLGLSKEGLGLGILDMTE